MLLLRCLGFVLYLMDISNITHFWILHQLYFGISLVWSWQSFYIFMGFVNLYFDDICACFCHNSCDFDLLPGFVVMITLAL